MSPERNPFDRVWNAWRDLAIGFGLACLMLACTDASAVEYGSARIQGDTLVIDKSSIKGGPLGDDVRTVGNQQYAGRTINAPAPGGRSVPVLAETPISKAAAFKMAAKALALGNAVGVAFYAADLYIDYRCRSMGVGTLGLECDLGATPGTQIVSYTGALAGCGPYTEPNLIGLRNRILQCLASIPGSETCSENGTAASGTFYCSSTGGWNSVGLSPNYYTGNTTSTCTGGASPGLDGKCPTGTYTPRTEEQAAAIPAAYPPASMTNAEYEALIREAMGLTDAYTIGQGALADGTLQTNAVGQYGTLDGIEEVTVNPDASTVGVTTGWTIGRVADNIVSQERYKITETKTRTTTSAGGQTTTTTTTTTGNDYTTDSPSDPASDTPTEVETCPEGSTAAGCQPLGDPGDDAPVIEERSVSWVQESLGLPASCPAPTLFPVRNWQFAMDWTPACNVAPYVRAGVLALTLLGVAFFLVRVVNGSEA